MDLTSVRVAKKTTRFAPVLGRPKPAAPPPVVTKERTPGPPPEPHDPEPSLPEPSPTRRPSITSPMDLGTAELGLQEPALLGRQSRHGTEEPTVRLASEAPEPGLASPPPQETGPNEQQTNKEQRRPSLVAREEVAGETAAEEPKADGAKKRSKKKKIKVAPLPPEIEEYSLDGPAEGGEVPEPPPNPQEVISNLTLTELIEEFEGSIPSKSQLDRAKARTEKQRLKKLRARRNELISLGISLPPHLQNLPPESDPEDEEDDAGPGATSGGKRKRGGLLDLPDRPGPPAQAAPQLRIVDGQIQIDESSLFVDLHGAADRDDGMYKGAPEESSNRRHVTSFTYMRRKNHSERWTNQDTEKFYEALTYWGTDFSMIALCFGDKRNHKQIKLKYHKEEKLYPTKVLDAIKKRRKCGRLQAKVVDYPV